MGMKTPMAPVAMTPEQMKSFLWERELDDRNRALSDEELDALFPPGYKVRLVVSCYVDESLVLYCFSRFFLLLLAICR